MKVAFDVKGTIEGHKKDLVLRLFKGLQDQGHTCFVWSNLYSYATDAIRNNNLENTEALSKYSKGDVAMEGKEMMDICIEDDRSQSYLGSRRFIFVDELNEELIKRVLDEVGDL